MFVLFNIELLFTFQWKREQLGQKSKGAVISFLHIFLIKNVGGRGGKLCHKNSHTPFSK